MHTNFTNLCVPQNISIRDAIAQMDSNRNGIVLVIDGEKKLVGTVTDGDVRRAILDDVSLEEPVGLLLERKSGSRFATPITASASQDQGALLKILQQHGILHLPLVDDEQRVVDMVSLGDFLPEESLNLGAVIMAGGAGYRLRPLTEETPKPMLPVGDRPLMELIIEQLKNAGIKHVNVTVHHKQDKITRHFGDGGGFGIDISYLAEDRPLGTAGALGLMGAPQETVLVINGDILTRVDFRAMLDFHREHEAEMTVAVRQHESSLPYGVVDIDGVSITGISEKPTIRHLINAGIYLLEPSACRCIPPTVHYDMTDLIGLLLAEGRRVVGFPIREYWLDIGDHADYQQAQKDAGDQEFASS